MKLDLIEFREGIKRYVRFSEQQATEVSFNYSDKRLQVVGTDLSLDISKMSKDEVNALVSDIVLNLSCLPSVYCTRCDKHPVSNAILRVTLLSPPTNKVLCEMLRLINTLNTILNPISAFKFIERHDFNGRVYSAYTDTFNDVFQSVIDFIVGSGAQSIKCDLNDESFYVKIGSDLRVFPYKFFR